MTALWQGTIPDGAAVVDLPETPARLRLPAGMQVLTMTGPCAAEALKSDDRLITRARVLRLAGVAKRLERGVDMFRVSARALGHDRPADDILLPADQPILLRDWRAQALFGQKHAVVPLHRLADGVHIRPAPATDLCMVCLSLPRGAVLYAGGLELPSLPAAGGMLS